MRNGSNSLRKEQVLDCYASELGVHLILGGAISPALDAPGQFNQLPVERRREIAAQALGEVLPRARAADAASKSVRPAGGRKYTADTIAHMHRVLDAAIDRKLAARQRDEGEEEGQLPADEQVLPAGSGWSGQNYARHLTPGAGPAMDGGWMSDAEKFERDAAGCME
jgi:hypothetical protein